MSDEFKAGEDAASDHDPFLALVGSRIRAARRRAKLRQADLAKAINTSQSYIGGVELGLTNLSMRSMVRIATALGVAPVSFFTDKDPLADGVLDQLAQVLSAMQDNDRARAELDRVAADLLRQAQALAMRRTEEPTSDAPP